MLASNCSVAEAFRRFLEDLPLPVYHRLPAACRVHLPKVLGTESNALNRDSTKIVIIPAVIDIVSGSLKEALE